MEKKPTTRYGEINTLLSQQVERLYRLRRLSLIKTDKETVASYVVTVKKNPAVSFEARTEAFYRLLLSLLREDEQLVCRDRCFRLIGGHYTLIYCFEGYRKNADLIGYMENGAPRSALVRRMGCERAVKELGLLQPGQVSDIYHRMSLAEMQRCHPNPADRFVASVNTEKCASRVLKSKAYRRIQDAVFSREGVSNEDAKRILKPLGGDSLVMSTALVDLLEIFPAVYEDEPALPQFYDHYAVSFQTLLEAALAYGMDPNELVPYEEDDSGDNLMWSVVGNIRHSIHAPAILKLLLDRGGDPNLHLDAFGTVFDEVDDFFWLNGEALSEALLQCWLLLAAYGGLKGNRSPLSPLPGHTLAELKDYRSVTFSFETVTSPQGPKRVLFIVDKQTGERVAVNEAPFAL